MKTSSLPEPDKVVERLGLIVIVTSARADVAAIKSNPAATAALSFFIITTPFALEEQRDDCRREPRLHRTAVLDSATYPVTPEAKHLSWGNRSPLWQRIPRARELGLSLARRSRKAREFWVDRAKIVAVFGRASGRKSDVVSN